MNNELGFYADEIIYYLKSTTFANEYYDMNSTQRLKFLNEILQLDSDLAELEAKEMKNILSDHTLNKLAKYTHEKLGLASLECGYNIDNEKCISCARRKGNK